ncbi:DegQ family serine endoprotease [Aquabacterium sp. OR-4]|uniref:DegQ family serine endoprotease n=1 Tax=Aquabacterium sp. OR-4 TaxID=2978127 RepID=UPI0028C84F4D|nr:DegQ family serine endoprotease [Aquabacterium sp. OR-4]MDT7834522.1 DegQ family serine endoprotease [Aquabacterium sp. OR-4]
MSMMEFSLSRASRAAVALAAALMLAVPAVAQVRAAPVAAGATLPDFTELVEKVGPSVVGIRTLERANGRSGQSGMDPSMEEFFRRFGIPMPGNPNNPGGRGTTPRGGNAEEEPQQRGVGSGFVLSADGFIMTNAHVVDGADELIVTLTDKREFKAKVIGLDKRTDVAVVKIDATGLPAVKLGDVGKLKVGEWVLAIGSPFGLENTVTAGIVSAKARDTGDYLPFIQTDVAINPGNSGGPLINMRGEVVGINSQIYSRSGGFMGISFAIPIDEAGRVADQLRAQGRVIRGRIGVSIAPVTKDVAESIGLGKPAGALVRSVEGGGPAEKAGLEAGDIITKVDGKAVEKSGDLPRIVGATRPGSKAVLQVFRRGGYRDITVTVAEFEPDAPTRVATQEAPAAPARSALGLTVTELTEAQRRELKLKQGVRVEAVDGAAARAGLREGDVVLALDNVEISDVKQFLAVATKAEKARAISVMVRRGEWVNYLVIRPTR